MLLEGVFDFLAGLLEIGFDLMALTLGLQPVVSRGFTVAAGLRVKAIRVCRSTPKMATRGQNTIAARPSRVSPGMFRATGCPGR